MKGVKEGEEGESEDFAMKEPDFSYSLISLPTMHQSVWGIFSNS